MLPTFVITMKGTERERWISEKLEKFRADLDITIISQESGSEIDQVELAINGIIKLFPMHRITDKLYDSETMSYRPGTLGCMLGHFRASRLLLDNGAEFGLVLEDNVEFCDNWIDDINNALKILDGDIFDIIHLYSGVERQRRHFRGNLFHGHNEWGTSKAQIISRKFARFVQSNLPFHEVSDGITMIPSVTWLHSGLKSYVIQPNIILKSSLFKSTRMEIDRNIHATSVVFRRVPGTSTAFFAGSQKTNPVFEYNNKSYFISFGVGRAEIQNGRLCLSGFLTDSEIEKVKSKIAIFNITPGDFSMSAGTEFIYLDEFFRIITKRQFIYEIGNDEILFLYLQERTVNAIRCENIHPLLCPDLYYERPFSPFKHLSPLSNATDLV